MRQRDPRRDRGGNRETPRGEEKKEEARGWIRGSAKRGSMIIDKKRYRPVERVRGGFRSWLLASSFIRLAGPDGSFNFPVNPIQFELRQTSASFIAFHSSPSSSSTDSGDLL